MVMLTPHVECPLLLQAPRLSANFFSSLGGRIMQYEGTSQVSSNLFFEALLQSMLNPGTASQDILAVVSWREVNFTTA